MFTTATDSLSPQVSEPDEYHWTMVERAIMLPWLIAQVVTNDMAEISDVLLDDVDRLLRLCSPESEVTVLDVHMVMPPPWPWDGQMRVIQVKSLGCVKARKPGQPDRGFLTTELGHRFGGQMIYPLKRAPARLVRLKAFPDMKELSLLYGLSDDAGDSA